MKILFDQGVPDPLRRRLAAYQVETAHERGWSLLENGELIAAAESNGFEIFITTDQNLKYQQNLEDRHLAILVLLSTSWPRIERHVQAVVSAIEGLRPGAYTEVAIT